MIFEKDVDSFLLRYLLNELAPEDREKVEEWMAANEKNRQYYRAYQKTHLELRWTERSKKIEGNFIQFNRLRRKRHFRRIFYRSVACAVILLSVGVLSGTGKRKQRCNLFRRVYNLGNHRLYFTWLPDRLLAWIKMPKN